MALIICSECGKEFSDKAAACPNCGCPTEEVIQQPVPEAIVPGKPVDPTGADTNKTKVLRDYLEKVRQLETDFYTIGETIRKLTSKLKAEPKPKVYINPPKEPEKPSLWPENTKFSFDDFIRVVDHALEFEFREAAFYVT